MSAASEQSPASTTPVCADGSGEWEQRMLCPDDSCIGVLGPDGRCCLCGLRGDLSRPYHVDSASVPPPASDTDAASDAEAAATDPADAEASPAVPKLDDEGREDAFGHRELCPDDSCIGVLGPDGLCPLCGRKPGAER